MKIRREKNSGLYGLKIDKRLTRRMNSEPSPSRQPRLSLLQKSLKPLTKSEKPKPPCFCDTFLKVMLSNFILIISVPIEIFWLASERPVLMARYIQASNGIIWICDFMIEPCLNSATFTIIFSCFWSEANRKGLQWDSDQIFILEGKTRRLFLDLKLNDIW